MSVTIDNTFYNLISEPDIGNAFQITKKKIKYQSQGGYNHQREAFTAKKRTFPLKWSLMPQSELNTLMEWMDLVGSDTFGFVDPTSLVPLSDGSIVPVGYYCRVSEDTLSFNPKQFDGTEWRYEVTLVFEEA